MPSSPLTAPGASLFVTAAYSLQPEGGGVQRCTREYLALLQAAGFAPEIVSYPMDHSVGARLRRRLFGAAYRDVVPRGVADQIEARVRPSGIRWIFFNQTEAGALIPALAPLRAADVRFALLSHGLDSTDFLHTARTRVDLFGGRPLNRADARWLGQQLFAEMRQHQHCDAVFCLSETDLALERWVGGRNVHWLPRAIDDQPLDWRPVARRLGTVGTLIHAPNYEGIFEFCRAVHAASDSNLTLRLVGTPEPIGRKLAAEFSFVSYLGGLNDDALVAEARSWCGFVNPIFCYPRGCSTKLAVPLGWRLPIASTRAGARGYFWDESLVPLADSAAELVQIARTLAEPARAAEARAAVGQLVARSPRLPAIAARLRAALDQVDLARESNR